jgi:Ser/Thr protein kinase RdoA (MazF antagonist)
VRLARGLFADMSPLVQALASLPRTLVHGDLKLANMGVDGDILWLFDWADVSRAPVALEIAWFLAVNSSRLPRSLDATLDHYATQLQRALGDERLAEAQWPAQRGAAMVCGLLMYGWGKALDAETGRPDELRWWCEGALEAQKVLRL